MDSQLSQQGTNDDRIPDDIYDDSVARVFDPLDNPLGAIHIICVAQGSPDARIAPFIGWGLALQIAETDQPVFSGVALIVPPGAEALELKSLVCRSIAEHRARGTSSEVSELLVEWLSDKVKVVPTERATIKGLQHALAVIPTRTIVAVVGIDKFEPGEGASDEVPSTEAWKRTTVEFATLAAPVAAARELFIVVDTAHPRPSRTVSEMLRSIADCSVFSAPLKSPEERLEEVVADWRATVAAGRIGAVLDAADTLTGITELDKVVLRIEILAEGGISVPALSEIRELSPAASLTPRQAATLAVIAANSGGLDTAVALLARFADEFDTQQELEKALRASLRAAHDDLAATFADRLADDFPSSAYLVKYRYQEALRRQDHREAHTLLSQVPGKESLAKMHADLAEAFGAGGVPDYLGLVASSKPDMRERVRVECARHALSLQLTPHAIDLLLAPDALAAETGTYAMCDAFEAVLLHPAKNGDLAVDADRMQAAFDALVTRLGNDTTNGALRVRLLDLIDQKVSGHLGGTYLLKAVANAMRRPVDVSKSVEIQDPKTLGELLKLSGFKDVLRKWCKDNAPLRVGHARFPAADLPAGADQICEGVLLELDHDSRHTAPDQSEGVLLALAFGTAVAQHASVPDLDLPMIRVAAIGFVFGGNDQQGRDTVETMLEISATTPRRRLAWFGMADVYARCHMTREAALYAAAGLSQGANANDRQYWHETLVAYRIQREMGAFDDAARTLLRAERQLAEMGVFDEYRHQIETNRIANEMSRARVHSISLPDYTRLLGRMVDNAKAVIEANDEPGPAAVLLVQMIRLAEDWKTPIPPDAGEIVAKLTERMGGALAEKVDVLGRDVPSADDLLALIRQASGQRYSSEVGTDVRALVLTARRALNADQTLADPDAACLAIEMTCDRALAMPGWTDGKSPAPAPTSANEVADALRKISKTGTSIILAGLATDGSLVRVTATNGSLSAVTREDPSLFSRELLDQWSADYPFTYGMPEMPANAFYTTTESLRLSHLAPEPLLMVWDTRMASFPPNLLRAGAVGASSVEPFAGASRPISYAPSLGWLNSAIAGGPAGNDRRLAWIPGGGTMAAIADYCGDPFERHGVLTDREERLPDYFSGASLAFVAAHGSRNHSGGAFQLVADEGSLAVTAGDLARSLHNVRVVVLFVCSGGRSDKHPAADATIGLAREVLDQGAQVVVASPWPLESLVPPRWVPKFLERWDLGDTVSEAVHAANRELFDRSQDPATGLAMNVFGNPFVRK